MSEICSVCLAIILILKINECKKLKEKLDIKITENLSLKRVMYENDLIPEKFVK